MDKYANLASKIAPEKPKRKQGGKGRPIQPGQVLNPKGRPKGARQKLDEVFVAALYADFKEHGVAAVQAVRTDKPDVYLNVIAKVVPKQVDLNADDSVADFAKGLQAVAEFLGGFAAEQSSADHAGIVPDRPVLPPRVRPQAH